VKIRVTVRVRVRVRARVRVRVRVKVTVAPKSFLVRSFSLGFARGHVSVSSSATIYKNK
jgi:hypothetical protein